MEHEPPPIRATGPTHPKPNQYKKVIETVIFSSRWLLIPFYFGLFATMLVYTWVFFKEIIHLVTHAATIDRNGILLITLELVDIVMIANLVKMIITGSYHSFVDKNHKYTTEKASSGMLKVKMHTSLIGVSSIQLLQTFIRPNTTWETLSHQLIIHAAFIGGALILAYVDYLHEKAEHFDRHSKEPNRTNN